MNFAGKDSVQQADFFPHDVASMAVYPTGVVTLMAVIKTDCARRCLASPGCTMFSVDSGNCILTKLTNGPAADVTQYSDWYIRL